MSSNPISAIYLTVWPSASYLSSQVPRFFICKMAAAVVLPSRAWSEDSAAFLCKPLNFGPVCYVNA